MSCGPVDDAAGRSAKGLWRRVLSALNSPELSDARRQELLALGAAELAWTRTERRPATATDVQRIAFEEFSLLLDARQARAALQERRSAWQ
ncbi:hypothetical protein [Streptomyces sp. Wb2n-11]|uniref:hypothetical protein n=1 Tax=Streptomyces sp. Wb2n-11 TaxID=1030533 RepID=UPI000B1EF716|nr:hypothetical protein [Streptomyces sp. Wb2n-11]